MRRNKRDKSESEATDRPKFCPNCGAPNPGRGLRCTICGHLYSADMAPAQFWDSSAEPKRTADEQDFIDRYADDQPAERIAPVPEPEFPPGRMAAMPTQPYKPVDPWSSAGGKLGAAPGSPEAFVPPHPSDQHRGGPPGWVLGLVGLLLIAAVAVAALILVVRPMVSDRVESATNDAIVSALAETTVVPDATSGTILITEAEINQSIRANQSDYKPLEDVAVQILRRGIKVSFSVYGVSGTLNGSVDVRNGKLVIINPSLSGAADRLIDVDNIARDAADAINELLARNNLKPTAVSLSDDRLTITTAPA
jgi:hypothetical protein